MELFIETERYGVKTVLIDDDDWPRLSKYTWHIMNDKGNFYARCFIKINGKFFSKKMHRMVLNIHNKSVPHIDHKDHNGLNNQKTNLRKATIGQNSKNVGPNSRNTTGYKGVYQYKKPHLSAGLYTAALRANGKKYHGGYFKTAIEAAKRYNELALQYHGEFAYQNKIP